MTPKAFIDFARQLRELGAGQVSAGEYAVTFPTPVRAVVAPLPKPQEPPHPGTEQDTPEGRAAYRDHVLKVLNG
jgi:hypothetical protein